ncbi:hypothetical protein ERS044037_01034 [Streptococcus pneumoniae]|nr:hypothetical protein ERS044037_01034 [Streptococcus pneumoniae]
MNIWTKLAMFSFFETDRLYLRPFFFSDSQDFREIASNPENLQFWECGQFVTRKINK